MNKRFISISSLGIGVVFIILAFIIDSKVSVGVVLLGTFFINFSREVKGDFTKLIFLSIIINLALVLILILHLSDIIYVKPIIFLLSVLLAFILIFINSMNTREK